MTCDGLKFCEMLHARLSSSLRDVIDVTARVEKFLAQNAFRESCFCKGCVLPIVDEVTTGHLAYTRGAAIADVRHALRCEGFDTPMYACGKTHASFSGHSRSNSYHPGDKSGRRAQSRRSPDFCIRYKDALRMLGEVKYVASATPSTTAQVVHELRDYLAIKNEPTSDGLIYSFAGTAPRKVEALTDYWESDRIFISRFLPA